MKGVLLQISIYGLLDGWKSRKNYYSMVVQYVLGGGVDYCKLTKWISGMYQWDGLAELIIQMLSDSEQCITSLNYYELVKWISMDQWNVLIGLISGQVNQMDFQID